MESVHLQGAEDMDAALADNIARKSGFKETDLNADDEYDFDTGIDMYQKRRGDQVQLCDRLILLLSSVSFLQHCNTSLNHVVYLSTSTFSIDVHQKRKGIKLPLDPLAAIS